ncbi:FkbM family methyltransferase [Pontimonas sp.]|nr:FkbM family methyltransferase [Pontimonas sp.]
MNYGLIIEMLEIIECSTPEGLLAEEVIRITASRGFQKKTKVKGRPVDEILNGRTIDFCLIDAQGWEHEIVRGMPNTLSCNLPTMVVEFVPDWIADLGQNPHDVLRAYEDLGYCLSILDSKEGVRAPAEIIRLIEDSEGYFCDLVLRPI